MPSLPIYFSLFPGFPSPLPCSAVPIAKSSVGTLSAMSSSRRGEQTQGNAPVSGGAGAVPVRDAPLDAHVVVTVGFANCACQGGGLNVFYKGRDVTPQSLLTAKTSADARSGSDSTRRLSGTANAAGQSSVRLAL